MTSPALRVLGWFLGACLGMTLASPSQGQITITASRQDPAIPRAYVGADIPKGLGVYMVMGCNAGASEASVFVDRVIHEVSQVAPVQDGAAVLYAAREHKGSTWKVAAYRIGGVAAMAAGGFASAGASTVLGQVAGGVGGAAGISTLLKGRASELARLDVPANWWTPDPTRIAALKPGQCMAPLLVALAGAPGPSIERTLISQAAIQGIGPIVNNSMDERPDQPRTHPVDLDPLAEVRAALELNPSPETERAWRERLAQIGAGQ